MLILALAFMAGEWVGKDGDTEMEEVWLAPKGGLMLGAHRDVQANKAVSFEHLRIETAADGTIALMAQPGGRPPTAFKLTKSDKRRAVFENPTHDFPTRITYWSDRESELCAMVEGPAEKKIPSMKWCWARQKR